MKRSLVLVMLLAVLAGCGTNAALPPIMVGHVSDKTRPDKAGDQAEHGIRLALAEWTKDNTIAGRGIQVRHTDAHGQAYAFESQAVRLTSVNRCAALLGGLSASEVAGLDRALTPLLTFYGQPVVGASNLVFYLGMAPARQGEVLARYAADDAKTKRVALVVDERRPESLAVADAFQKAWIEARKDAETLAVLRFAGKPKADIQPQKEKPAGGHGDFLPELFGRIQSFQPQAIVFAGEAQEFNKWLRVYRQEVFIGDAQLIYAGDDGAHRLFDLDGDAKTTIVLATAFSADAGNEKIAAFLKAYREAFETDADVHAALAYDTFRLLVDAMKRGQPQLTQDRLREELQKTKDFEGLTGPLTVTATRQIERPLHVIRWQNGTFTKGKTYPPDPEKKAK